jgi:hypothetical protein
MFDNFKKKFNRERLMQAAQEFAHTFIVTFAPLALAFWNGIHTGDNVVIPDFGTVKAFLSAAGSASALAGAKGAWWFLTGTVVIKPRATRRGKGGDRTAVLVE